MSRRWWTRACKNLTDAYVSKTLNRGIDKEGRTNYNWSDQYIELKRAKILLTRAINNAKKRIKNQG